MAKDLESKFPRGVAVKLIPIWDDYQSPEDVLLGFVGGFDNGGKVVYLNMRHPEAREHNFQESIACPLKLYKIEGVKI